MAMNGYIGGRKQKFVYRKANIVDLLKRNKLEEKKKKEIQCSLLQQLYPL